MTRCFVTSGKYSRVTGDNHKVRPERKLDVRQMVQLGSLRLLFHRSRGSGHGFVGRQAFFPVVLPQIEMLPKNFACFCPKSDVDRDENLSTVRTFLQDTCAGW